MMRLDETLIQRTRALRVRSRLRLERPDEERSGLLVEGAMRRLDSHAATTRVQATCHPVIHRSTRPVREGQHDDHDADDHDRSAAKRTAPTTTNPSPDIVNAMATVLRRLHIRQTVAEIGSATVADDRPGHNFNTDRTPGDAEDPIIALRHSTAWTRTAFVVGIPKGRTHLEATCPSLLSATLKSSS